ncbi:MAG: hypothetical protein PHD48_07585 [Alphaproteobacteria bacterium]|nr:hypothetical protein [Alphaproteobacteria bacterium]
MPWLEKDHYSFDEIAKRWGRTHQDLAYFAERGQVEVQTWLSDALITQYTLKKTEDGEVVPVETGIVILKGYYIVDPDELRKVFRSNSPVEVRRFFSLDRRDVFSFRINLAGFLVGAHSLEISKAERDRFEACHNIVIQRTPTNKTGILPTSLGRPSAMKRITKRFNERASMGAIEPTLQAEARVLREWAKNEWSDIPAPALKTIANNLRPHFQNFRASAH